MRPQDLPIQSLRQPLRDAAQRVRRLVLQAPTGSGKSTQIPQILLDESIVPAGQVVILQPRRLAARMLARRVAEERGVHLGTEVGYHIRFDRIFGTKTRIKFVTEGILLRQMLAEPNLPGVSAVVFDEFHERHLYSDLALAMARRLQQTTRPDLLIVVMSATLDTASLATWLQPCEVLSAQGRTYPITIEYSASPARVAERPLWEQAAYHFSRLAERQTEGDFLIFMPGAYEIQRTIEALLAERAARAFAILPLHGELPPRQQDAAVEPSDHRKVVVATNVAETSITIDGIRTVIDSGLARIARFDPHRGINTLLIENISQSSADQRAGRAGRTAPGLCLRMWGEREHLDRPQRDTPEIRRIDLSEALLWLKAGGVDTTTFPWFEAPDPKALARATGLLTDLGALDPHGALTPIGRRMAEFPVHPRYARMLLAAQDLACVPHIALIAALTQGRSIMLPLRDKRLDEEREQILGDTTSDLFHLIQLYEMARARDFSFDFCRRLGIHAQAARQAGLLADQFLDIAHSQGLDTTPRPLNHDAVRRCLLTGFIDQLALREDVATLRCRIVHNRKGELRRQSAVRDARLIVAAEVEEFETRGDVTVFLSLATAVDENWLRDLYPEDFSDRAEARFDPTQKRVVSRRERRFRDLVLESRESGEPPPDQAARLLADEVSAGRLQLREWDDKVEAWIARLNFVAHHCPDLAIQPIDDAGRRLLVEQLCYGATSCREIKEKPVWNVLHDWLSREQRLALDSLAPETFDLPNRRRPAPIRYEGENAILSATVQDFYDAPADRLKVAGGRVPLTLEILAPNRRPVQITRDLAAFWTSSYHQVKKDLRGRYPKHEWR